MLLKVSCKALPFLCLLSSQLVGSSDAVSGDVNASIDANPARLGVPLTPGFSLSEKVLGIPGQEFKLLNMLHLTNNLMKFYAVRPFDIVAPGHDIYIPQAGNLILGTARAPGPGPSEFLVSHALWGLWKGAFKVFDDRDFRTGRYEFILEGVPHRIGGVIYQIEPTALANAINHTTGFNGTTEGSETVLTTALDNDDVPSQGTELVATTKRSAATNGNDTRYDNLYIPPPTPATAIKIFDHDYALNPTSYGQPLNRLHIFFTIYESIIDRASKPDRHTFLDRNYEYTASTGYRIGYRPHQGSTLVPEYEAIIFGLTSLVDSMRRREKYVETWFQILGEGLVPIFDCYINGN